MEKTMIEQAYLISRGVRPLALVDTVEAKNPVEILKAYNKMQFVLTDNHPGMGSGVHVIPFAILRKEGDWVDVGFAARAWVVDTLKWIQDNAPQPHLDRLLGLMLGYSPDAIAANDESGSGELFPDTITALDELDSNSQHGLLSDKGEMCPPC